MSFLFYSPSKCSVIVRFISHQFITNAAHICLDWPNYKHACLITSLPKKLTQVETPAYLLTHLHYWIYPMWNLCKISQQFSHFTWISSQEKGLFLMEYSVGTSLILSKYDYFRQNISSKIQSNIHWSGISPSKILSEIIILDGIIPDEIFVRNILSNVGF